MESAQFSAFVLISLCLSHACPIFSISFVLFDHAVVSIFLYVALLVIFVALNLLPLHGSVTNNMDATIGPITQGPDGRIPSGYQSRALCWIFSFSTSHSIKDSTACNYP